MGQDRQIGVLECFPGQGEEQGVLEHTTAQADLPDAGSFRNRSDRTTENVGQFGVEEQGKLTRIGTAQNFPGEEPDQGRNRDRSWRRFHSRRLPVPVKACGLGLESGSIWRTVGRLKQC